MQTRCPRVKACTYTCPNETEIFKEKRQERVLARRQKCFQRSGQNYRNNIAVRAYTIKR